MIARTAARPTMSEMKRGTSAGRMIEATRQKKRP